MTVIGDENLKLRSSTKMTFSRTVFISLLLVFLLLNAVAGSNAQTVVDKTVARVSDSFRTELITMSDLMWQIALQPGVPIDSPSSEDLGRALDTLINQRIFALEAERLPRNPPTETEIRDKVALTVSYFRSPMEFESRLKTVGFSSIRDETFERMMSRRLAIDKYADFRFRSFVVITADEVNRYYRDVYTPEFRRRSPGLLLPTLEEVSEEIRETLIEDRVAERIEEFLEDAKRRIQVEILIEP